MLTKNALKRTFVIEGGSPIILSDPDPSMSPDAVLALYSSTYPQLVCASVGSPRYDNDGITYPFKTTVGTKG